MIKFISNMLSSIFEKSHKEICYCCTKLETDLRLPSTTGPNVRMVKFLPMKEIKETPFYRFFITMGYDRFSIELPKMNIKYCPYCGKNLFEIYRDDSYVNEVEGQTFHVL